MAKENRLTRAAVIEALEVVSGLPASELRDSTPLVDANMDSLSVVAMLSLVEARCETSFDSDAAAEIVRAADVGGLIAAISRAAARRKA